MKKQERIFRIYVKIKNGPCYDSIFVKGASQKDAVKNYLKELIFSIFTGPFYGTNALVEVDLKSVAQYEIKNSQISKVKVKK